jgi:hypothetical protein
MLSTHFEVQWETQLVRTEYLYNLESQVGGFLPARIFEVTSYKGHVPTFSCIVDNRFLFHYLPVQAFAWKEVEPLTFEQANYVTCPSETIEVVKFKQLDKCHAYNKGGDYLGHGKIISTIEWPNDNELCHLIKLDSGNLVLRPSHKIALSFDDDWAAPTLPAFKKLRKEWKLKK